MGWASLCLGHRMEWSWEQIPEPLMIWWLLTKTVWRFTILLQRSSEYNALMNLLIRFIAWVIVVFIYCLYIFQCGTSKQCREFSHRRLLFQNVLVCSWMMCTSWASIQPCLHPQHTIPTIPGTFMRHKNLFSFSAGSLSLLCSILAFPVITFFWTEISHIVPVTCWRHCPNLLVTDQSALITTGTNIAFTLTSFQLPPLLVITMSTWSPVRCGRPLPILVFCFAPVFVLPWLVPPPFFVTDKTSQY